MKQIKDNIPGTSIKKEKKHDTAHSSDKIQNEYQVSYIHNKKRERSRQTCILGNLRISYVHNKKRKRSREACILGNLRVSYVHNKNEREVGRPAYSETWYIRYMVVVVLVNMYEVSIYIFMHSNLTFIVFSVSIKIVGWHGITLSNSYILHLRSTSISVSCLWPQSLYQRGYL